MSRKKEMLLSYRMWPFLSSSVSLYLERNSREDMLIKVHFMHAGLTTEAICLVTPECENDCWVLLVLGSLERLILLNEPLL